MAIGFDGKLTASFPPSYTVIYISTKLHLAPCIETKENPPEYVHGLPIHTSYNKRLKFERIV